MSDLPPGWAETTVGEIAETSLGKMLDRAKFSGNHLVPYLRNVNVQWGRIDLQDVLKMDIAPDQQDFFRLAPGDLLVCEGGEIGRCAIWSGSTEYMAFQKALHRIRPFGSIESKFVRYLLEYLSVSGRLRHFATGSTIKHLPQEQLRRIPVHLPPIEEQRRIVAALEGHLSRLEAAGSSLSANLRRLTLLSKRIIVDAVPIPGPAHWKFTTVAEAGAVDLGRQRHPDWHTGPNMRPYLRVANVFEDHIDSTDIMEMDFPPEVYERFRLTKGDVLLNEGQSPEFLGRPAMYRGEPPSVAFTNSLLRFRARSDVDPEWALLVFRRHMHAGRFIREVRITTNIAHLSAGRFKRIEFPIPPVAEQGEIFSAVKERLSEVDRIREAVRTALARAAALRRSLLFQAFVGQLVPQDSDDEPAAVLLTRIRVERSSRGSVRRTRQITKTDRQETRL